VFGSKYLLITYFPFALNFIFQFHSTKWFENKNEKHHSSAEVKTGKRKSKKKPPAQRAITN
jgi:hypothetical protein